jgi:hypothetical protein
MLEAASRLATCNHIRSCRKATCMEIFMICPPYNAQSTAVHREKLPKHAHNLTTFNQEMITTISAM